RRRTIAGFHRPGSWWTSADTGCTSIAWAKEVRPSFSSRGTGCRASLGLGATGAGLADTGVGVRPRWRRLERAGTGASRRHAHRRRVAYVAHKCRCLIKPEVSAVATLKPTEVVAHRRVEHARAGELTQIHRAVKRSCEAVPRGSEGELPVGK